VCLAYYFLEGVFVESEQKCIDDYICSALASCEILSGDSSWMHKIPSVERWITRESVICKRVFRLRSYAYLKIPWFNTSLMWNYLSSGDSGFSLVPNDAQWITRADYLDADGNLAGKHKEIFENKKRIYEQWVQASLPLGYYAEEIYRQAFSKAGYFVKKRRLPFSAATKEKLELDAYCVNEKLRLGVQIKNVSSEVFTDPETAGYTSLVYRRLEKQFEYCLQNDIVPILIAPFIDKRFYNFSKRYRGLHCQTYLSLFSPKYSDLYYSVKETLKFGNIKVVTEATNRVKEWIEKIPQMWNNRYAR
jgi:hypothetical protein